MAVINPLKVVLLNYDESKTEILKAENNPEAVEKTYRDVAFSKEIFIDRMILWSMPVKDFSD